MSESKLKVQVLEGADNKLDLAKLEDVLKRQLIIPSYQRPYAWTVEDIEEIFQTISNPEENTEDAEENKENIYFFGSIILSKKEKNGSFGQEGYYIIDGQQRLSSFLLILRVVLDVLNDLSKISESINITKKAQIVKENELKNKQEKLKKIIDTVSLERESSPSDKIEKSILDFIKNGGNYDTLTDPLKKKVNAIYNNEGCPLVIRDDRPDSSNLEEFFQYIDKIVQFVDRILNKIKFCLICITGEQSEDFAINLFNTLNTTGQPLTAFEVLKSELHTIDKNLSNQINGMQRDIIEKYAFQRKKIVTHTGKLLLYLALYRGDFTEKNYTLSDKRFKDQRSYLKEVLNKESTTQLKESATQLVEDIKNINDFYSNYWLKLTSLSDLLKSDDEQVCFQFLSELKHDRVLPLLIRFHKNDKAKLGQCVKMCTAFSSLWRAYFDGGTSSIDNAYKNISLKTKDNFKIETLSKHLKEAFLKKLSSEDIKQVKEKWIQKMQDSPIYKNQKLSKFLLFLAYNQTHFNKETFILTKGKGIDILNINYWKHSDYKTIEHIIPKSDKSMLRYTHTLGNLTLLPQELNSSLGDKDFSEKVKQYKQFCKTENEDRYPYLPVIKHIAHYDQFKENEIKERSKIFSEFIWKTLAEDWLDWKEENN